MAKTKYTMIVYLRVSESSELKELLKENKFMIVVHDVITNEYHDDDEELISRIMDSNRDLRFLCMYNEDVLLPQEIIRRIDNDPSVITFTIDKRTE